MQYRPRRRLQVHDVDDDRMVKLDVAFYGEFEPMGRLSMPLALIAQGGYGIQGLAIKAMTRSIEHGGEAVDGRVAEPAV